MSKNKKEKGGYISANSNNKVLLFAIAPIILTGLYILSMGFDSEIKAGTFSFVSPITQLSVTTIIILLIMCAFWVFVGYLCAKSRVVFVKSLLICNAFPILCFVLYYIFVLLTLETTYKGLDDITFLLGGCSFNFFGIAGTLFYSLVPINYLEPVIDLALMLLCFTLGYVSYIQIKKKQS